MRPATERCDRSPNYPSLAIARNGAVWVAWQSYKDLGDQVYVSHSTSTGWSQPDRLSDNKGDVFHTAVGEDAQGRIWVVWSERDKEDWDLYARRYDGRQWGARAKLTTGDHPDLFHRLVTDRFGALHLIWTGYRNGQSHVLWSRQEGAAWSSPVEISGDGAWMPDAAADSQGNLYVAWDSYRAGNYDIFLRRIARDGALGSLQQVTRSPRFQAHASVTVDAKPEKGESWYYVGVTQADRNLAWSSPIWVKY